MTTLDQRLFPGQWFLERRESPGGKWEVLSRDNDEAVMQTRYEYAAEMLKSGQSVKLSAPDLVVFSEKVFDTPAVVA